MDWQREFDSRSWSYGSQKLVVQDFSAKKGMGIGNYVASKRFTVGGHEWEIRFHPDGKNPDDNSAYISIFIVLVSEESTGAEALFELALVDQSGKGKNKINGHFDKTLESGPYTLKYKGSMWGYKCFFRRNLFESSDYIKDDCLEINATIAVMGPKLDSQGPATNLETIGSSQASPEEHSSIESVL